MPYNKYVAGRKRITEPKCASGKNSAQCWRCAFVLSPQAVDLPKKSACAYDGSVTGQTIYAYVHGNPISRIDVSGLADYTYDFSISSNQNPVRQLWNETSARLAGMIRGPDYVAVSVNLYIVSGGVAMNLHNGNVYKQGSLLRNYPAPSGKPGFCAVAGSILGAGVDGAKTDSFLGGAGNQASYFLPAGNPFIGVGGGMGHAYGGAYSLEYGLGTPGAGVSPATYGWAK